MTGVSFFGYPLFGQTNAGGQPVGMIAGAAIIFFAYIGFDSVSTHAEEAKNPHRDVPIGIIASLLICTVLYIAVVAVLTGMVPYDQISVDAGVSDAFKQAGLPWAEFIIAAAGVAGITSVLLVMMLSAPRVFLAMARDGMVPQELLRRRPSEVPDAVEVDDPDRRVRGDPDRLPADRRAAAHDEHRHAVRVRDRVRGGADHAADESRRRAAVPRAVLSRSCRFSASSSCLLLMFSLPVENWYRLFVWMAIGFVIYFTYSYKHSELRKQHAIGPQRRRRRRSIRARA